MQIVDCFPWFAPYGEELLYLRVNLLKDHVDKFIIVESNKTHAGKPVERKFPEIARKLGLPIEKIIYIEHDIPDTEDLEILDIDRRNAANNASNKESLLARVRERLQKDAVMLALRDFDKRDVFLYGDADEIINPLHIKWLAKQCHNHPNLIIKVPLVYLQGRADLRVHHADGRPLIWKRAMFFATKEQLQHCKLSNIRCGNIDIKITFPTNQGVIQEDMGWHFAWMGTNAQRQTKADSFAHAFDSFKWHTEGGYSDYKQFVDTTEPVEGNIAPDSNEDHFLKRFPHSELPAMVFDEPLVKNFLLPSVSLNQTYAFNDCKCYWCEQLEWPLMYDLEGNEEKLWFEVPRSCSVTIKESFPNRKQIKRGTRLYAKLIEEGKKPIMIFTDPIDRFISLINVYLTQRQRYVGYGKDIFDTFDVDINEISKQEKIDLFFANLNKITSGHQVHHFHPQCRFVDAESFSALEVVKREDVNEYFDITEHHNSTRKEITAEDLSVEQIDFIKRAYASDYAFYDKYGVKNGKTKNKRKNS
jgi:hypothetical protein|tara:strand:+ start:163 stop:1752 length:1590 start_codon:yes stop_codon:yes gene_type:complete